eukprot:192202_1
MAQQNTMNQDQNKEQTNLQDITEKDLELKQFTCPRCQFTINCSADLFSHMRANHQDPTVCHLCGRDLKSLTNLLSHYYVHKDIKPYKCPNPMCNYSSRTKFNLKVHLVGCAGIEKFQYGRKKGAKLRVIQRSIDGVNYKKPIKKNSMSMCIKEDNNCRISVHQNFFPTNYFPPQIPTPQPDVYYDFMQNNENRSFELLVQFNGNVIEITTNPLHKIGWIKNIIEQSMKIPIDQQQLTFNELVLQNEKTVDYYNIAEDCVVNLNLTVLKNECPPDNF